MKIGIIGNGFVGSAIVHGFILHVNDILIYDTFPEKSTHSFQDVIEKSDFIFVCVPTPMYCADGGEIDLSIMDAVMERINDRVVRDDQIIIIKSTVVPGTVERYSKMYPNLKIVFNPEFLTERKARLDFINTARIVIGGDKEDTDKVEKLYRVRFPHTKVVKTSLAAAQLIKYMANCFFAVKVSFMNEMKQVADACDADWHDVIDGFVSDGRVGNSHLDVPGHDGQLGFGGKCFPKDINAMIYKCEKVGVDPLVLKAAWAKNVEVRTILDWIDIEGAVSKESS